MTLPTYATGTASVSVGGTVVTGVGTIWSGINVKQGDFIAIGNNQPVLVTEVTDTTHLKIPAWTGAVQSGVAYTIYQNYVGRVVGVAAAEDVGDMLERLKSYGPVFAVPATDSVPDPSYGAEGQYAYQQETNTWWQKTGGVWVMSAAPVKGYGGTSTTSITIGTGAKAFTTQPGLAYLSGQRVRAIVSTDATKWLEGVATYNASTGALSIASDATSGSGTFASWGFTVGASDAMAVRYDIAQALNAAQKSQARANIDVLKKNYVINGAMMVSQENGSTAITGSGYPVDQFGVSFNATSGVFTSQQIATPGTPAGSPDFIKVTVTTADAAIAAGDLVYIFHRIEGLRCADLLFGLASARTVTLQFGVISSIAGTYCVVLSNSGATRSYVAEYSIAAGEINTAVVRSITIPGDVTGTWLKDNSLGIEIRWGLMVGSTFQQAAGSWGGANAVGSANQVNFMATVGNNFSLFDVGLYEGQVAPAFQLPDYQAELASCQRFAWVPTSGSSGLMMASAQCFSGTASATVLRPPVQMRATPTLSLSAASDFAVLTAGGGSAACTALTLNASSSNKVVRLDATVASGLVAGNASFLMTGSINAKMLINARL